MNEVQFDVKNLIEKVKNILISKYNFKYGNQKGRLKLEYIFEKSFLSRYDIKEILLSSSESFTKEYLKQIAEEESTEYYVKSMNDIYKKKEFYFNSKEIKLLKEKRDLIETIIYGLIDVDCITDQLNLKLKVNIINSDEIEYKKDIFDDNSNNSIHWLAKEQGKENEIKEEFKKLNYNCENFDPLRIMTESYCEDEFVNSVVNELINVETNKNSLTFLATMDLFDIVKVMQYKKTNKDGYIILPINTVCGLVDYKNKTGSLLKIKLRKDIYIPFQKIYDICADGYRQHMYDVSDIFKLSEEYWDNEIVDIVVK